MNEVTKSENKVNFYFKNTNRDINMTEKHEELYRNENKWQFCEEDFNSDKVRDHCQLTNKFWGPAHKKCNVTVTEKQSNFIPFVFQKLFDYDCHLFFNN